MWMRTDPLREFDQIAQQLLGLDATPGPAPMAMDVWRDGDTLIVEFDLPGVRTDSLEIDVERNVLTVRAERPERGGQREMLAAERRTGLFGRQLVLGDDLDLDQVRADYGDGVLRLSIPVAAKARPRKIEIATGTSERRAISS
ncbi:MAG: Hsp20 family protein [Marmoricola sp.]|jgi:HSP20 family protein|nr:Hsp20 family protein [Marmoricola sp.]